MTDTAAHLAGLRGRINATLINITAIDLKQAARGLELQAIDLEASYYAAPGSGVRSSEISDPTHAAATRRRPTPPGITLRDAQKALDALGRYVEHLKAMERLGDPVGRNRPEGGQVCRGGVLHKPDENGNCIASGCRKRFVTCSPDVDPNGSEPRRFEDCQGATPYGHIRCSVCELSIGSAVCRKCGETKELDKMKGGPAGWCHACYMDTYRERRRTGENAA